MGMLRLFQNPLGFETGLIGKLFHYEVVPEMKIRQIAKKYGKFALFCIAFLLIGFSIPRFMTPANLLNIIRQSSIIGICSIGVTMIIITRGIDLSTGGIISLCGMLNGSLLLAGVSLPVSLFITLMAGGLWGTMDGFLIARLNVPPFICTFVFGQIAQSVALILKKGRSIGGFPDSYVFLGNGTIAGIPLPDLIMVAMLAGGALLLSYTAFGNHVYAIGHSDTVAREEGINIRKVKIIVYIIAGFCTAVSGVLLSAQMDAAHPTQGEQYQLDTIAACIIGGVNVAGAEGKILNSILGALLIGAVRNALNMLGLHPFIQNMVVGTIIIIIVAISIFNKQMKLRREKTY
jgi:ribose/xylose/arabinose/galactoside ABC-type transport system permease subunit